MADCSADQELLGLLRWVDHVAMRGVQVDPADARILGARYRGLMSSRNLSRLGEAGHLRKGEAVPQLLGLTESILAEGRIKDVEALNGALHAVYLQLSDECEQELGSTLKDWVVDSREMIEDDIKVAGGETSKPVAAPSAGKVAGLAATLAGLIGIIFGLRIVWVWAIARISLRRGCRIDCDLVIGDNRFQGFITVLARKACRFEFPQSTINDFRAALAKTTNCTIVIGGLEIDGVVQTLRPSSIRIDFHKALDHRNHATLLARSLGPALRNRKKREVTGDEKPARNRTAELPAEEAHPDTNTIPGRRAPHPSAAR